MADNVSDYFVVLSSVKVEFGALSSSGSRWLVLALQNQEFCLELNACGVFFVCLFLFPVGILVFSMLNGAAVGSVKLV